MRAPFSAQEAASAAAAEAVFGERLRFTPRRAAGKFTPGGSDPARAFFEFIALVTVDQGVHRADGAGGGSSFGVEFVGAEIRVNARANVFSQPPVKGDHIAAIDRPGAPAFEIIRVAPDNIGRIVLHCARVET